MQDGTPSPTCQICKCTVQSHERSTCQDGDLYHALCLQQRTRQFIEAERKAQAALQALRQAPSDRP